MIEIPVRFLGGLRATMGTSQIILHLPEGATVGDLKSHLVILGVDLHSEDTIIVLNDLGIEQYPADRPLVTGDEVVLFPNISGG
jgi:molybdopterin converting factor small subunit